MPCKNYVQRAERVQDIAEGYLIGDFRKQNTACTELLPLPAVLRSCFLHICNAEVVLAIG